MPIGFGVLLGTVISIVRSLQQVDARSIYLGLDGMRMPLAAIAIGLVFAAAAVIAIRPKRRTMFIGSLTMLIIGFAATRILRIESFYGNMIPRLTWRWSPTAEQSVKSYLVSNGRKPLPAGMEDAAFSPTDHDYPGFLGARRDAHALNVDLAIDWSNQPPKLLWRHPVGLGWSSFAIQGQVAVNLEQRGEDECIVCYNLLSGEEIWCHAESTRFVDEHGDGPRSTPTIYRDRVYALGATGLLTCVDLRTGGLVWKQSALENPEQGNLLWGMSGSPLIYDDFVLVTPGAGEGSAAIAYSHETGREVWRSGDDPAAYASPVEVTIAGERQLLSFNGAGLRSYAIDGSPLWFFPWLTQGESQRVNVAQPVPLAFPSDDSATATAPLHIAGDATHVLISSGYDNGMALLQIKRSGPEDWFVEQVWASKNLKSKMSNFLVYGQSIYGLDNGILTCLDLADGQRRWKRGRYGHGQLLAVGDKLLIQAESGEVAMVAIDPKEHRELGRFQALDSKTWNHMAISGNILVVRNDREAAAFELPLQP